MSNYASHIVGGEMIYDYLGNNKYRITLKIYRDCSSQTTFDGIVNPSGALSPANISVLEVNSGAIVTGAVIDIDLPVITHIPPTINSPCIQTPNNICVEEGVYTETLTLPPIAGGYYVIYQRCCRNNTILNLLNSGSQSSTYYAKIPGPEVAPNNSSPRFQNFPPIFLCNNLAFTFNHAAIDPDGDNLVYSLCPPFLGIDGCCNFVGQTGQPQPGPLCDNPPPGCPQIAPPPPYQLVNYVAPYDGSYPVASNPSLTIDPNTGLLKGTPNLLGQFVVGVCVQEFRNNVLISTHFRDFQFNIVPCIVSVISAVANQDKQCIGNTLNFTNQSTSNVGALTFLWDFGVPGILGDTSNAVNPSYTYQDTGKYTLTLVANPGRACSDTAKKTVYVYPPLSVDFDSPDKQCLKNNSFKFITKGVYLAQTTYTWDFTSAATPSNSVLKDPSGISFKDPGLYYVKLMAKQFACTDSTIDSVRVLTRPVAKINNLPLVLCDPATVGFSNGSLSELPLKYYWSFSNGKSSTDYETIQVFTPPGTYKATLMVVTQKICSDTSIASFNNILVNPSPKAGFSVSPQITSIFEPEITISNKASFDALSWNYNLGDGSSSVFPFEKHLYQTHGDFTITQTVGNRYGCFDSTRIVITILPEFRFWIPNTFTPDGNSRNDLFGPTIIGVTNYEFEIFDRWGQKVFKTNDVDQGWDGYFKGVECKQDVYAWRISFRNVTNLKKEVRSGHVLILKNL
ncbi:MAG: PKD domain-containing protein [Bacteroidota bacterium]